MNAMYNFKRCIMSEPSSGGSPAVGSPVGTAIGSAIGAASGFLGTVYAYHKQKELMELSKEQQLELWRIQTQYSDPKEQMKRLKAAGLNPDLIYGKIDNSAPSMSSVSTPQVQDFAGNTINGALAASQIKLQDSQTLKNEADTKAINTNTQQLIETFDSRLEHWRLTNIGLDLNNQKTQKEISMFKNSMAFLDAQTQYIKSLDYKIAYEGLTAESIYRHSEDYQTTMLDVLKSEARLNKSTAAQIEKHTRFFVETWDLQKSMLIAQKSLMRSQSSYYSANAKYISALEEFTREQMMYFPFQIAEDIAKGRHLFKLDDKGNVIYNDDGTPQFDDSTRRVDQAFEYGTKIFNMIAEGASVFGSIGMGIGAIRGFGRGANLISSSPISSNPIDYSTFNLNSLPRNPKDMTYEQARAAWHLYNSMDKSSEEAQQLYFYLKGR